jgi:hypothetical protein
MPVPNPKSLAVIEAETFELRTTLFLPRHSSSLICQHGRKHAGGAIPPGETPTS